MNSNTESIKDNNNDSDFKQKRIYLSSTEEIYWTVRNLSLSESLCYSLDSPSFKRNLSRAFAEIPRTAVSGLSISSPSFVFQNATWCLRLYPKVEDGLIGLTIVRLSSRVPHHRLHYNFIWTDGNYTEYSRVANFNEDRQENGSMNFISVSSAIAIRPELKRAGIFRLMCQVSCYGSPSVAAFSQTERNIKDGEILSQSFKDLLLNGQKHDVVLKVRDREFRAHQDILRVRSPVLESMLNHDMIEKNRGAIDIPDCDPDAFQQFLLYLYSGEVETLDTGNILALYYIADKYDVRYLKEKCREFVKISLTSTNVSDAIQMALNHSDADLLENATEFFVKHVNEVLRTVEWQSFVKHNPIQGNELFIKATENMTALIKMGQKDMSCIQSKNIKCSAGSTTRGRRQVLRRRSPSVKERDRIRDQIMIDLVPYE